MIIRKQRTPAIQEQPNILLLASPISRFTLLPISNPTNIKSNSTEDRPINNPTKSSPVVYPQPFAVLSFF